MERVAKEVDRNTPESLPAYVYECVCVCAISKRERGDSKLDTHAGCVRNVQ